MILVDTSVWIDFLQGENNIYRYTLHNLIKESKDICLTEIILTEILQGIKEDEIYNEIKLYMLEFPIFSLKNIDTYIMAANIYRQCRKENKIVRKTVDCLISAVAIENNLILMHKDKDFDKISECTNLKIFKVA